MRKKLAQYRQLAGVIVEGKIFDLSEDEDNLRNIWEVVGRFRRLKWTNTWKIPEAFLQENAPQYRGRSLSFRVGYEYVSQLNRLQPVQGHEGEVQLVDDAVAVDVAGEDAVVVGVRCTPVKRVLAKMSSPIGFFIKAYDIQM